MSAGHGHKRANLKHPRELRKLLTSGGAPELMARWQRLDVDHDIPDLAGYNVFGTVRFLDRDFFRALLDPEYAEHIGLGKIDTGLSPDDAIECLLRHEAVEKVILDADNDIDVYDPAHEYATLAEHECVRQKNGRPIPYERALKKSIKFCARKPLQIVPRDLGCGPYLDETDANDKRIIEDFRRLGVEDAFKESKRSADYSKATGEDQCHRCAFWQGGRALDLSPCAKVAGLVRKDRWCRKYKARQSNNWRAIRHSRRHQKP